MLPPGLQRTRGKRCVVAIFIVTSVEKPLRYHSVQQEGDGLVRRKKIQRKGGTAGGTVSESPVWPTRHAAERLMEQPVRRLRERFAGQSAFEFGVSSQFAASHSVTEPVLGGLCARTPRNFRAPAGLRQWLAWPRSDVASEEDLAEREGRQWVAQVSVMSCLPFGKLSRASGEDRSFP